MLYDLIIRDALVIDGSNRPGVRTDVAISDGRIQRIGSLIETRAREEVNAAGRVLAHGFIDVHTRRHGGHSQTRDAAQDQRA